MGLELGGKTFARKPCTKHGSDQCVLWHRVDLGTGGGGCFRVTIFSYRIN